MTATQRGLDGAVCNILSVTGESLIGVGVYTAWTAGTGLVPLTAGALTLLAQGALCSETDIGPASGKSSIDGCREVVNGYANLEVKWDGIDWTLTSIQGIQRFCSIDNMPSDPTFVNGGWGYTGTFTGRDPLAPEGGCTKTVTTFLSLGIPEALAKTAVFRLQLVEGICSDSETPGPVMPTVPDYEYTDPETNCTLNYEFQGMVELTQGGEVSPVFLVSGGDYQAVRSGEKVGDAMSTTTSSTNETNWVQRFRFTESPLVVVDLANHLFPHRMVTIRSGSMQLRQHWVCLLLINY